MQGVTEVLPVSSSAHLELLPRLLGWQPEPDRTAFAASLHLGSAVGLALALRHDLRPLDRGTAGVLALTTLPAAIAGAAGQQAVERRFGGRTSTAALTTSSALLMWLADRRPEDQPIEAPQAAAAATAQVLALAPGVSRAGATVTALRALRVPRDEAVRFSRLMSLPITAGAAGLTSWRSRQLPPLVPSLTAGLAAYGTARLVPARSAKAARAAALYRLGLAAAAARQARREGANRR